MTRAHAPRQVEELEEREHQIEKLSSFFSSSWIYRRSVDVDSVEKGPWHEALEGTFAHMLKNWKESFRLRWPARLYHPNDSDQRTTMARWLDDKGEASESEEALIEKGNEIWLRYDKDTSDTQWVSGRASKRPNQVIESDDEALANSKLEFFQRLRHPDFNKATPRHPDNREHDGPDPHTDPNIVTMRAPQAGVAKGVPDPLGGLSRPP